MNKIGVFYGSTTGTTEDVARRIAEKLNVPSAHIFEVSKLTEALVNEYDVLVLGSSTWGAGELQDDWYDGVKKDAHCKFCGAVDTAGYTFDSSIAVVDGKFIGLPIDEVNEDNQTEERISAWAEQVKQEIS